MPITEVMPGLSFCDIAGCAHAPLDTRAIVHACKEPCHRHAVDYVQKSLDSKHPQYLHLERENHLYLNLIDPPVPLFKIESFGIFFDFMDRQWRKRPILIHCNKGESRAPSLTLLYMAKYGHLPSDSYANTRAAFEEKFPYKPGKGIVTFLEKNWGGLMRR